MKSITLLFSVFILASSACGKKTIESTQTSDSDKKKYVISEVEAKMNMPDCLQEFADLNTVINADGEVVSVMDMMMISYKSSSRVNPCNLPDGFNEGDKVTFSGVIKEAPKGVRLAGTPFKLSSIRKR